MVEVRGQRILVTGATGFVGHRVCALLESMGAEVVKTSRAPRSEPNLFQVDPLGPNSNWKDALQGCHAVVHLAARVHVMNDESANPLHEFRLANTAGTLQLARQSAQCGVKRLVFVSSIKVNGEAGEFTVDSQPNPIDPYGISKFEAEQQLFEFSKQSGLEVTVVRPPLVYGPGVRANFLKLLGAVARGIPLPFGAVHNKRSLVFVGNLASAIASCVQHPNAVGRVFLVSDNADVSTAQLVREMANALGRKPNLLPVPPALIETVAALLGKRAAVQRLLGNLTVSPQVLCDELNWSPPFTLQAGMKETVDWYLQQGQLKIA
ncbi:MAG: SDR family oxidoreductase [Limnobacter sp.]|uniref:UDP-glucose 4-epimerase family protein n=1 Tax=Limnobacter sp. TaxID=2003368 RepID=UPI0032EF12A2